jgi:hypothetical protein
MQQGFQPMTSWLNLTLNTDPKLAKLVTDRVIDSKYRPKFLTLNLFPKSCPC